MTDLTTTAIERSGIAAAEVVKVHQTPAGIAVVTAKGHAVVDPGDALAVSVQRDLGQWAPTSDQPDPVADDGAAK